MGLKDQITADLKRAMLEQNELRRTVLRSILAALTVSEKDKRRQLNQEEGQTILQRQAKMRREAAAQFTKGGRSDRAEREMSELAVIQDYLPQQMTPDQIVGLVRQAIDKLNAQGDPKRMGEVMSAVMPQTKGRADGRTVSETVRKLLAG